MTETPPRTSTSFPVAAWSYDDNITGWNALFGEGHEDTQVDPTASPGRLIGATRLPPTCIEVGHLDIFVDEDVRYALTLTLSQAGVPVELRLRTGVPREFEGIAFDTDVARRTQADRIRVLQRL